MPNMNRRVLPIALLAALMVGGSLRWRDAPRFASRSGEGSARVVYFDTDASPDGLPARTSVGLTLDPNWAARAIASAPVELDRDAGALVGEVAALQALAAGKPLALAPEQWLALAEVTRHHQAIRQAYEASIAIVSVRSGTGGRMEIPAYAATGDALRARVHAEITAALGPLAGANLLRQLGPELEAYFAGFGVSAQTLEFAGGAGDGADFQVTRTVRYWNAFSDSDRLSTRRETYFPALEDPSGHTWGPFLSRLSRETIRPRGEG